MSLSFNFNIINFIEKNSEQSGEITISKNNFPRVFDDFFWNNNTNDKATTTAKVIKYNLKGYTKEKIIAENGEKQLDYFLIMYLNGEIPLQCQRCLSAMQFELNSQNLYKFELTKHQQSAENFDLSFDNDDLTNDDYDVIYIDENLRSSENNFQLNSFIEDEIILTIPSFPMHKHCSYNSNSSNNKTENKNNNNINKVLNQPFSNLKNLLNQHKKD